MHPTKDVKIDMAIRIGDWCCCNGGSPRLKVGGQGGDSRLLNAILSLLTVILLHLEAVLALFPSGPLLERDILIVNDG